MTPGSRLTRLEILHVHVIPLLPTRPARWTKPRDRFLERPGKFSGAKANFKITTCWIVAQFLAHKPFNFVSLTVVSLYYFQNYWIFDLECKHKKVFRARKDPGTFEKQTTAARKTTHTQYLYSLCLNLGSWLALFMYRIPGQKSRLGKVS